MAEHDYQIHSRGYHGVVWYVAPYFSSIGCIAVNKLQFVSMETNVIS